MWRLLLALMMLCPVAQAAVTVDANFVASEQLVPGQRLQLRISVATDGWLNGGTAIQLPRVDKLLILQTDAFARNATERREGVQWTVQHWYLDLYPQRAGSFQLPPFNVVAKTADASGAKPPQTLVVSTPPFIVRTPPAQPANTPWIATPRLSITDTFDRDPSTLQPGEAVTRTIIISAEDVLPMMLPALFTNMKDDENQPGRYVATPTLQQDNNRGILLATRSEQITYVLKSPGRYVTEEKTVWWWNTAKHTFERAILPAVMIGAPVSSTPNAIAWRYVIYTLAAVLTTAALLAFYNRPHEVLQRQLNRQLRAGNAPGAVAVLYEWLRQLNGEKTLREAFRDAGTDQHRDLEQLLQSRYTGLGATPKNLRLPASQAWWRTSRENTAEDKTAFSPQ